MLKLAHAVVLNGVPQFHNV